MLGDYLRQAKDGDKADYAMVGYILGNTLSDHGDVNRAVCTTNDKGELQEAVETLKIEHDPDDPESARYPEGDGYRKLPKSTIVSMNMFGFTPSIFDFMGEDLERFMAEKRNEPKVELYIPTVVNKLIAEGRAKMQVLESRDSWFGVTYTDDKPHVAAAIRKLIAEGRYPEKLWV